MLYRMFKRKQELQLILQDNNTTKMRKAFTMIELVFVIAIIGVLTALVAGLFFSAFTKNEAKATLKNDVEAISRALIEFKTNSPYANPSGTFGGIGATYVARAVSEKMDIVDADNNLATSAPTGDYLKSLGANGDCKYFISSAKSATGIDNRAVKVFMDCSVAKANKGWTTRDTIQAEETFIQAWREHSLTVPAAEPLATAIGAENAAPTLGGTIDDGKVAVTGIVE